MTSDYSSAPLIIGAEMGEAGDPNARSGLRVLTFVLRSDGVTWRVLDDEVVVLDLETSLYLKVTGSGAVVWPLLAAGTTLDAMVDAVVEVYDIDDATARNELADFLDDLRERKLLR